MKKALLAVMLFVLTLIAIDFFKQKPEPKPQLVTEKAEPPVRHVYVGAWVGGFWENNTKTLNVKPVKDFETLINKKLAIVNIYADWTYLPNPSLIFDLNKISDQGWVPMISSNPMFFESCPKKDKSLYETIADGDCDAFLSSAASNLAKYQKPVMLRFAWEMNLPNMYWSVRKLGSKPEDFVNAWRRFYTITKSKAPNVSWVLSFNTSSSGTTPYKDLFPGDEYLDWVAIDGYNWGNSHEWSGWASFDGTFRKSYNELIALSKKPVMLSEVNSAPSGGDKALWLSDMLETQIPNHYTQVESIIFFNENKQEGESVDWRLEKSKDYAEAVKQHLKNTLYVSSFP